MTKIKNIIGCLAAASSLSLSATAASANEPGFYLEGAIGQARTSNVDTKTYSVTADGITLNNFKASVDYDSATYLGFEIGLIKPADLPIRVGFGMSSFKLKANQVTFSGTLQVTGSPAVTPGTVDAATIRGAGLDFDNDVKIYSVNAYYDFDTVSAFKPYIGAGLGLTDIENAKSNETTMSLHLGVNYDLGNNLYLGAKYSKYFISGPKDKLGIDYEDVDAQSFGLLVGYRF